MSTLLKYYIIIFLILCTITILSIYFTKLYQTPEYNTINYIHNDNVNNDTQIPNIIHQTYKTNTIPNQWHHSQLTVRLFNRSYKYKLWTDKDLRELIEIKDPQFLKIYDSYPYPIQRVDVGKYFILYYYGGFYIDLDIGSLRSLDNLRNFPCILPKTEPIGYSNDFIGSIPGHPFIKQLIHALPLWNINFILPMLTIFLSTGPLFITNQYQIASPQIIKDVYILSNDLYTKDYGFFFHEKGNSWHMLDTIIINYIYYHTYNFIIIISFVLIATYHIK